MPSSLTDLAERFRITNGKKFRLKDVHPGDTGTLKSPEKATELLRESVRLMSEFQEKLYAQDRWALLLVFQAMDAAGKDGTIKHVMSGVNPQGCEVSSFKAPSDLELDHDFLWRTAKALPERGRIGIFNRSYYEDVLVVRVHGLVPKAQWSKRYGHIKAFEQMLIDEGTTVRKFLLHISKEEQRVRQQERIDDPSKNWKFAKAVLEERKHWDAYQAAFEDMVTKTSTAASPWYVIPANRNWYRNLLVTTVLNEATKHLAEVAMNRSVRAALTGKNVDNV